MYSDLVGQLFSKGTRVESEAILWVLAEQATACWACCTCMSTGLSIKLADVHQLPGVGISGLAIHLLTCSY